MQQTETNILVILAAGASSRMKRSLESFPELKGPFTSKALIPIGKSKKPAIAYLIDNAIEAGFKEIILVVPPNSEAFQAFFGNLKTGNVYKTITISYAFQFVPSDREKPLGTADAVMQTIDQYSHLKKQSFVVCNGDNLYSSEAFALLRESNTANALIAYDRDGIKFPMERIQTFALLNFDNQNVLRGIIEKPGPDDLKNFADSKGGFRVSMNIWKFQGEAIYKYLVNCPMDPLRNEKELPKAVLHMVTDGKYPILGLDRSEHIPDLTSAEDIAEVEKYLK